MCYDSDVRYKHKKIYKMDNAFSKKGIVFLLLLFYNDLSIEMIKVNKKIIVIGISLLFLALLVGGGTYAFYEWISSSTDVIFDVEGLRVRYVGGADIVGASLIPTRTKEEGISKTIYVELDSTQIVTPTPTLSLYLDLTEFPSPLADASFKWEFYKNDEINPLMTGSFFGYAQGDTIELITNEDITSTMDTYKIILWIDGNEDNNSDMQGQPFLFNLRATGANSVLGYYYELEGIIYKEDGSVCELCDVTVHSDPITTKTTETGYYYLEEIPVGSHTLIVEEKGNEIINDKFRLKKDVTSSITDREVRLNDNSALIFKGGQKRKISQLNFQNKDTLIVRKNDTYKYYLGTDLGIDELFTIDSLILNGGTRVCEENDELVTNINELSNGTHTIKCTVKSRTGITQMSTITVNIDDVIPTISAKTSSNSVTKGTSKLATSYFNIGSYGYTGGTTVCQAGIKTITNISSLTVGSYTLSCTMTTGAGKTATASTSLTIKSTSTSGVPSNCQLMSSSQSCTLSSTCSTIYGYQYKTGPKRCISGRCYYCP